MSEGERSPPALNDALSTTAPTNATLSANQCRNSFRAAVVVARQRSAYRFRQGTHRPSKSLSYRLAFPHTSNRPFVFRHIYDHVQHASGLEPDNDGRPHRSTDDQIVVQKVVQYFQCASSSAIVQVLRPNEVGPMRNFFAISAGDDNRSRVPLFTYFLSVEHPRLHHQLTNEQTRLQRSTPYEITHGVT